MSGTQIAVLLLIAAAFAAGWIAREALRSDPGDDARDRLLELLRDADSGLERAQRAYKVARNMTANGAAPSVAAEVSLDILRQAVADLDERGRRLGELLGTEHPLLEDYQQARSSLRLLAEYLLAESDSPAIASALERAATESCIRFQRTGRATGLLPARLGERAS